MIFQDMFHSDIFIDETYYVKGIVLWTLRAIKMSRRDPCPLTGCRSTGKISPIDKWPGVDCDTCHRHGVHAEASPRGTLPGVRPESTQGNGSTRIRPLGEGWTLKHEGYGHTETGRGVPSYGSSV